MIDENRVSREILDAAIVVHKTLGGPGLLESVYRDSLVQELKLRGLKAEKEVYVPVVYRGLKVGYPFRLDILVENSIIVECKAAEKDHAVFAAQTLTYLRLTGYHLGILINFGKIKVIEGFRRIVNGYLPKNVRKNLTQRHELVLGS